MLDVAASAVNRADLLQRQTVTGRHQARATLGLECSGTVSAVGSGVTEVGDRPAGVRAAVGRRLRGEGRGAGGHVLPVPHGVDLVTAAGLPEVMCTVWSNVFMTAGLRGRGAPRPRRGRCRNGGSARPRGGRHGRRNSGNAAKLDLCRSLGASVLVNYNEDDFVAAVHQATDEHGADVVLDNMGLRTWPATCRCSRSTDVSS